MKSPLWVCALAISGALSLNAALDPVIRSGVDSVIATNLDAFHATSVSVGIVEDGKLAYAQAYGQAALDPAEPATAQTRYAVGSISKQFTAAALLLAQQEGKLSIDDKVSQYFPDLTRAHEITIRQLLSHTSGYEDYAPQDYIIPAWTKPTSPSAVMDTWGHKPLNFDPGTKWQYSNTNYVIAGSILEKATGQSLLSFLDEHFFRPLAMRSAGEWHQAGQPEASAFTRFALGPPRPVAREGAGWYFAAGELAMTPSDLAKWDIALLANASKQSGAILSEKSYAELTKEVKLKDGSATHYALGLSVNERNGTPVISHSGEVSGFLASNVVYPRKNMAVIVFSNEDGLGLVSAVSRQLSALLLQREESNALQQDRLAKQVLEDLARGLFQKQLFTDDARAYFSDTARRDYQNSLTPLGKLVLLTRQNAEQRGGMTHLSYQARYEQRTVSLNIYLLADGKIEQFLVEEQF